MSACRLPYTTASNHRTLQHLLCHRKSTWQVGKGNRQIFNNGLENIGCTNGGQYITGPYCISRLGVLSAQSDDPLCIFLSFYSLSKHNAMYKRIAHKFIHIIYFSPPHVFTASQYKRRSSPGENP